MTQLVVLVTLVAMATAGVVVQNRPYSGYPTYGKDLGYGDYTHPNYNNFKAAPYPASKNYAPAKDSRNAYDYPYDKKFGYDYKPVYPANNYDYKYRPVTPVKKVNDPYSYYNNYRTNDPYGYRPVKKVADPFPAKAILPARKAFDPFAAKPVSKFQDPYPYNFGIQAAAYPVPAKSAFPAAPAKSAFPTKRVTDPYPYSYQPNYVVKKDPYPAKSAVYPGYPVKNVADPFYPSKAAYPARNVGNAYAYYDPYYTGVKRAAPAKTVATPVVKKTAPAKSTSVFGSFPSIADFGKDFGKDLFPNFNF